HDPFALAAMEGVEAEAHVGHAPQEAVALHEQRPRARACSGDRGADPCGAATYDEDVGLDRLVDLVGFGRAAIVSARHPVHLSLADCVDRRQKTSYGVRRTGG